VLQYTTPFISEGRVALWFQRFQDNWVVGLNENNEQFGKIYKPDRSFLSLSFRILS
jgi:hypothetical protein